MATEITPYLFLGSIKDAKDKRYTYIINVSDQSYTKPHTPVITLLANDVPSFKISKYFDVFNDILRGIEMRKEVALVHCIQGISRSATMAASHLMYRYGMTAKEAVDTLIKKRSIVNPNEGFLKQLHNYDRLIKRRTSTLD